jgi:selenocysteine lyase/cysteine desulfurase
MKELYILADNIHKRLGVISFYIVDMHYNLIMKLLCDRFGVQVRSGCVCAGTYGHYLLNVSWEQSHRITLKISDGDLSEKPGWVRLSLHPTMTNAEIEYIMYALKEVKKNYHTWKNDSDYDTHTNEFTNKFIKQSPRNLIEPWFCI